MKQLSDLAFSIIEYYEQFLGPFPFPEFDILEINDWGFGQAPPGVMFITKEAFNPLMGEDEPALLQGINERFAHEIAHQYWAHVVKMPSLQEQWLTESFAEYSAALFLKQFKGNSTYNSLVNHWKSARGLRDGRRPDPAREPGRARRRLRHPLRHPHRPDLRQGALPPRDAPQGAGRRRVPHLPEVVPEVLPMEVRLDQDGGRPAAVPDEEGLRPVLRGELLGHGNAQVRGP